MRNRNKQVYRTGDLVVIKNPEFFIRCGYPYGLDYGIKHLITDYEKKLLQNLFGDGKSYYKVIKELSYIKISNLSFGGNKRQIFTEYKPELLNQVVTVYDKKFVKTGTRTPAYRSYYDQNEYEPPYLLDEKTHVILSVSHPDVKTDFLSISLDFLEIEEKNVELYKNE